MIYRKIRAGTFPKPYKPGGASSRWSLREVSDWVASVKQAP
jgi:predicted DNA-binding transcriptional regulator AlpA